MPIAVTRTGSVAVLLVACGGAPTASPPPPPKAAPAPAPPVDPATRLHELTVYDTAGAASTCAPPEPSCPDAPDRDRDFESACREAGYRLQACGCALYCTGKVEKRFYDAAGRATRCEAPADCVAPPAAAAFQDACAERGHRLEQCGCAWLCSGDPTR